MKLSFEFFPPKTDAGDEKLAATAQALAAFKPEYFSVTYGASGSDSRRTHDVVKRVNHETGITATPHMTGITSSKADIETLLEGYQSISVKRLVVLRGDAPQDGSTTGDFPYAADLVKFIRDTTGDAFHISVAAYPEFHPEAQSVQSDIDNLKRKMDAGANDIITQYFFNTTAYFHFKRLCEQAGITQDITVGIMPINNFERLKSFSDMCGAEIPLWMQKQCKSFGNDKAAIIEFGKEFIIKFCQRLRDGGAPGFHFYTLNQAEPTISICKALLQNNASQKAGVTSGKSLGYNS